MLEYMRKNSGSLIVWLIVGAIAVVFVFFGIGGGGGSMKYIEVNGEQISPYEYQDLLDNARRAGGASSPEMDRFIKGQVISALVGETLAKQFGQEAGLMPSDQAVSEAVAAIEAFQVDGRFDLTSYQAALRNNRLSAAEFEDDIRRQLLAERAQNLIGGLSQVQKAQLEEMYHFMEDQVRLDYLFFPSTPHRAGLTPDEEALKSFYALSQERWRQPATLSVDYVTIKPADFIDQVELSENEIQTYYEESAQRFTLPESAQVAHILLRFSSANPSEEEKKAVLAKAEAAYARSAAEDFAALARELSEDEETAAEGGQLGQIVKGSLPAEMEQYVFSAPLGQVSQPLESPLGYHLLKCESRQSQQLQPLEEVRPALEGELKALKARQKAVDLLEELIIRSETNLKLAEAAAPLGLSVVNSGPFTADAAPDFFEADAQAVSRAFAAPLEQLAPALELNEHLTLFVPTARQDSRLPQLEEVKAELTEAWLQQEADRLTQQKAADFLAQAAAQGWETAKASAGAGAAASSELGSRQRFLIEGLEPADPAEFQAVLYSMARPGDLAAQPVLVSRQGEPGALALSLKEIQPADPALLEGPLGEMFRGFMSTALSSLMVQTWRNELFELSKENIKVPAVYME